MFCTITRIDRCIVLLKFQIFSGMKFNIWYKMTSWDTLVCLWIRFTRNERNSSHNIIRKAPSVHHRASIQLAPAEYFFLLLCNSTISLVHWKFHFFPEKKITSIDWLSEDITWWVKFKCTVLCFWGNWGLDNFSV